MAKRKYLSNYSIENIAQSIVRDNPSGKKYSPEDKNNLYQERLRLLEGFPKLKEIISLTHIHSYGISWSKKVTRLAVLPPEIIVVDLLWVGRRQFQQVRRGQRVLLLPTF